MQHSSSEINVDAVIDELRLDQSKIDHHKDFVELTERDTYYLRLVNEVIEKKRELLAEQFYQHLLQFPEFMTILSDADKLASLKMALAKYFSELTMGNYDANYVRQRIRVGIAHQRIGLDLNWYINAYRKYQAELLPILWSELGNEPNTFIEAYNALLKAISFDIGLVTSTYASVERKNAIQHQQYIEHILNDVPTGIIVVDEDMRIVSSNKSIRQMLMLSNNDEALDGKLLSKYVDTPHILSAINELIHEGMTKYGKELIVLRAEQATGLKIHLTRTVLENSSFIILTFVEQKKNTKKDQQLKEYDEQFYLAFQHANVGMAFVSIAGEICSVNHRLLMMLGYEEKELLQMTFLQMTHPDDISHDNILRAQLLNNELNEFTSEKRYLQKNGDYLWVKSTVSVLLHPDGSKSYFVLVEDISQRKGVEDKMHHLLHHDTLTNLPNRTLLLEKLSQAIIQARRARKNVAVLFIDIDRFKNINDSWGHDTGDQALREIGARLTTVLRHRDTVARLGDDEFVIILSDIRQQIDVVKVIDKINKAVSRPIILQKQEFYLSSSIGISLYPKDGITATALLKNADAAMFHVKKNRGADYQFYANEMHQGARSFLEMEVALRKAMTNNEFELYYQPQIDLLTGRLIGFEALIRWNSPEHGFVPPDVFIPYAEKTGIIVPLGAWVFRTACQQVKEWKDQGLFGNLKMSINLSARQFVQHQIVEQITQIMNETECNPRNLILEITESLLMTNQNSVEEILKKLHAMGLRFAIDDFGTGYSSLAYLKRFPIRTLKIDRSFIKTDMQPDDIAIVKAILMLAHAMNMNVVAEGVETDEQLAFLRQYGCEYGQGYFFDKPLTLTNATQRLIVHKEEDCIVEQQSVA